MERAKDGEGQPFRCFWHYSDGAQMQYYRHVGPLFEDGNKRVLGRILCLNHLSRLLYLLIHIKTMPSIISAQGECPRSSSIDRILTGKKSRISRTEPSS